MSPPPPMPVSDADLARFEADGLERARLIWKLAYPPSAWGLPLTDERRAALAATAVAYSEREMARLGVERNAGKIYDRQFRERLRVETATHAAALAWIAWVGSRP
jgi:hypothetical protein